MKGKQVTKKTKTSSKTKKTSTHAPTMKLKIGCSFPDGPDGEDVGESVGEVELPRVHGLMLAAILNTGGTPESAFFLGNEETEFTQEEWDYILSLAEGIEEQSEYPTCLPPNEVTDKIWRKW